MCGLAGAFGLASRPAARAAAVAAMVRAMCHRGPDDEGVCELRATSGDAVATFGHRRLSILDLSPQGHQPMFDSTGRLSIVFNGEIYNYRELRDKLARDGAAFRSGSDTEVILEGWARQGERFLPRLRGMFAFALWNADEGRGYLVRDRFGIKPMYVASVPDGLLFASELRAVLATGLVPRRLSRRALAGYLANGAVQEPVTAVEGVRVVPPGCVVPVVVERGRATLGEARRFAATLEPHAGTLETNPARAAERVRAALGDSVAHHLVSDVPVALFLSGGIDSSAIVALASQLDSAPLHTFTITFDEQAYNEAGPAAAVARRFRTAHVEVPLRGADLLAALPAALRGMDQPSLDGLNTFAVSAAVRRAGYKVVLSGLGGDELFAGYPAFARAGRIAPLWGAGRMLRAPLARLARAVADRGDGRAGKAVLALAADDPSLGAYLASRALFGGSTLRDLLGHTGAGAWAPEQAPDAPPPGLSALQRVSWYELTGYMRNTLLRDSDVFSMAHGLELRVPFLDQEVAAASTAVHDDVKLERGRQKALLVRALGDLLPREVWDRPKQGFELPFARWLRQELHAEVSGALTSAQRLERVGIVPAAARRVWDGFMAGTPGLSWSRPWALFTLVRWAEERDVEIGDLRSDDSQAEVPRAHAAAASRAAM